MILKANSYSIGRKSGEIWTSQTLLQPISFKSDRLLDSKGPVQIVRTDKNNQCPHQYKQRAGVELLA
ncbi:hypothetical protein SAMN05216316_2921 [Nitrosovibrio sp. Nv6]|nr:hypothetical protein SAMN05216316_2921 [Nitrosovibrio sp. Nv6]